MIELLERAKSAKSCGCSQSRLDPTIVGRLFTRTRVLLVLAVSPDEQCEYEREGDSNINMAMEGLMTGFTRRSELERNLW